MNKQNKNITAERIQQRFATLHMTQRELAEKDRKNRNDDQQVGKRKQDTVCDRLHILSKSFAMHMRLSAGLSSIPTKTGIQEANDKMLFRSLEARVRKIPTLHETL